MPIKTIILLPAIVTLNLWFNPATIPADFYLSSKCKPLDPGHTLSLFKDRSGDIEFQHDTIGELKKNRVEFNGKQILAEFPEQHTANSPHSEKTLATAGFTAPDEVCVNTPVNITNTSTGAGSYFWTFCSTNFSQPPDAVNIGNPGNLLSGVVFAEIARDNNGDYFVFATNNYNSHVTRLNFGNSLLNTPVADDLGNFGGLIPRHTEGIQVVNTNGRWFAIIQGGDPSAGDASSIAKIDFGLSLASTNPTATNWGNIGNLNYPHKLYLFQENNRWYGYATNSNSNTITRYDFGTDFSAVPTGVNLGNLGNLNLPVGITAINHAGSWYLFVLNDLDGTITRLSFGNSLLNTPIATNIGNPSGNLETPREYFLHRTL